MTPEVTPPHRDLETLRIVRAAPKAERKRGPRSSLAVVAVAALLLATAGYAAYSRTVGRPLEVQTVVLEPAHSSQPGVILTGSGYIVTRHKYITIGTKVLGQIVEEPIEEGQRVKPGDVLARIDDRDYQAQLRQAIAIRDLAEANVRLAQARATRATRLNGSGAISTDDFETAISAAEVAQAQLKRDVAAVDYAEFNVNQCVISSPINGIVLKKYRELGDTINYGGQLQAGSGATDIAQLADTTDIRAEVDINEADIAKIALGSPATVVPDAYADRRFEASLVKIYPEADRQKATVKVEVQIPNPDLQVLKPELSVKVSFLSNQTVPPGIRGPNLPKSTIQTEGARSFVWTIRDGVARRAYFQPGAETENAVEATAGLHDGDVIIIAPPSTLKEGQRVSPSPKH